MSSVSVTDQAERVAAHAHRDELALASCAMAAFVRPRVSSERVLGWLDDAARRVEGTTHLALRRVISIAEGLGGNVEDYLDPDNSFIDTVIQSRRGIPISLSIIWIEVGRRAGIEMEGVGLPGHFVVYAGGQMVDPFHYGEAIGFDEAAGLVAAALGGAPRLDRSWLAPVSSADIVRRVLRNLESIYMERGDPSSLEWVATCLEAL